MNRPALVSFLLAGLLCIVAFAAPHAETIPHFLVLAVITALFGLTLTITAKLRSLLIVGRSVRQEMNNIARAADRTVDAIRSLKPPAKPY